MKAMEKNEYLKNLSEKFSVLPVEVKARIVQSDIFKASRRSRNGSTNQLPKMGRRNFYK